MKLALYTKYLLRQRHLVPVSHRLLSAQKAVKKVEKEPGKGIFGSKNIPQLVEQLSQEELNATFSSLKTISELKEVKIGKFDRCYLLDELVKRGTDTLNYSQVLGYYRDLNYSSKVLSQFLVTSLEKTGEHSIIEDFLKMIPSREWNSQINRQVIITWLNKSFEKLDLKP